MPGGARTTSELFRTLVDAGLSVLVLRENRVWIVHVVKLVEAGPIAERVAPGMKIPALFCLRSGTTLDQALRAAAVDVKARGWLPS